MEGSVQVDYDDPEQSIQATKSLRATVTYWADDNEFVG